ncbi:MAG: hypothetical protein IT379_37985 [Deltaproteobacteria bacterium]|nr:hypothetical protein [Deltaproteobacteria bacterium]
MERPFVSAATAVAPHLFKGGLATDYVARVNAQTGVLNTLHIPSGASVQSVVQKAADAAGSLVTGLTIANTVIGAINLGVSVYTAYQVTKIRRAVDDVAQETRQVRLDVSQLHRFVEQSFTDVQDALRVQSIALGILQIQQMSTQERIGLLREELVGGLRDVHQHLLDDEAGRERLQLDQHLRTTLRHYRALVDIVGDGNTPDAGSVRSVIDSATALTSWTETLLARLTLGEPARLPLLSVKRGALRMLRDARSFETGGGTVASREEMELAAEIGAQARAFCDGRNLYELGVEREPLLREHIQLRRSLRYRPDLAVDETGTAISLWPVEAVHWEDGLEPLRRLQSDPTGEATETISELPIRTLADRQWLCDWHGVSTQEYSYVARDKVAVSEVLSSLGVPHAERVRVTNEILAELKLLAVESSRETVAEHLAEELDVAAPKLVKG